ncbi:hypothetical protein LIER_09421 [Lithospermum erythrorhizon]|uniref:Uncharacterized protein n=1 Tax=Lithospermum erythrorhizon TaxID=34254 RepID=A0AAV3PKH6_LITER
MLVLEESGLAKLNKILILFFWSNLVQPIIPTSLSKSPSLGVSLPHVPKKAPNKPNRPRPQLPQRNWSNSSNRPGWSTVPYTFNPRSWSNPPCPYPSDNWTRPPGPNPTRPKRTARPGLLGPMPPPHQAAQYSTGGLFGN